MKAENMGTKSTYRGIERRRRLPMEISGIKVSISMLLLLAFSGMAWSQPVPGFLEGDIVELDTTNRTARVNGVLMHIPAGIPISSPTVDLNALAATQGVDPLTLVGGAKLPGRTSPGFIGGFCLCSTEIDPLTGTVTVTSMVLEPAENVLLSTVTTHNCVTPSCDPDENPANELRVGGTLMNPNTDPRLVSNPPTNRGFEVDLTLGNLVGANAGAEGYLGTGDHLYFYDLQLIGGTLAKSGTTEVSILRARCTQGDGISEWKVSGATHDPASGTVTLRHGDTGAVLGTTSAVMAVDDPVFGTYLLTGDAPGTCSDSIIADFGTATTTSDVQVRAPILLPPPVGTVLLARPAGNIAPVAVDDVLVTAVNIELTFGGQFLLGNDTDAENDLLTIISVASASSEGGSIVDNLDGTFSYTPPAGFSGADTFMYTVADGYIPAVSGSVNVTVETPVVDNLVVQKAIFETGTNEWLVRGTSSIVGPGNTVTVYLGSTVGGNVLGTAVVDALGDWDFREKDSLSSPGLETTVSVISTTNGITEGYPITFK